MSELEPVGVPTEPSVAHLSRSARVPLSEVYGGSEPTRMTPAIAANLLSLNEPLLCRFVDDEAKTEVDTLGRSLDVLAMAEIPTTGDQVQVAIENQYGTADPDHFGRLVGWYMPETGAEMGVLVAEDFEPQLVRAVEEGRILRPLHGLWLVEACGYKVGSVPMVVFSTRATSLRRDELLDRRKAFSLGPSNAAASRQLSIAQQKRAAEVFQLIASSSSASGTLRKELLACKTTTGFYRALDDREFGVHRELFVGSNRIAVGSNYYKVYAPPERLDALEEANSTVAVEPAPSKVTRRGVWWDLVLGVGYGTAPDAVPADLGVKVEAALAAVEAAIATHQEALLAAAK